MSTPLDDLSRFDALDEAARSTIASALAAALGADFAARRDPVGRRRLLAFVHRPSKLTFVVVPGGDFEMGLTDEDIGDASEHVAFTKAVGDFFEQLETLARPVRRVKMMPFLCSTVTLQPSLVRSLSQRRFEFSTPTGEEAKEFIEGTAFRLPSEAELEWLARDGGKLHFTYDAALAVKEGRPWPKEGSFGVQDLLLGEWAADEWHLSYEGAPSDSRAWTNGGLPGVYRGALPSGPDQSEEELLFGMAAWRGCAATGRTPDATVRLALDLPT